MLKNLLSIYYYILDLYSLQSILDFTPAFVISCCVQVKQGNVVWVKMEDALTVVPVPDFLIVHISEFLSHPNGW